MKNLGWVVALLALPGSAARPVSAAEAPAAIETSTVEFKGGAGPVKGYLARPTGDGPFPAIVAVHEWWGLADWIKQNADRLAGRGYAVLAVDLYRGKVTNDPGEAHELMRALDPGEGLADLKGGIAYIERLPYVAKGKKVGAIGWCMGGMYSRMAGQSSLDVGPTVICYGSVSTEPDAIAQLTGKPVLGIFGATDRGIPVDKVQEFGKKLQDSGSKAVTIKVYEGAGHGFMRPGGPQYHAASADDAWKQIDAFFDEHLKK
jgi:carboxymethylenebutenolidase